ncbi:unnamed protein product, partial [Prorocentrum cordatum]
GSQDRPGAHQPTRHQHRGDPHCSASGDARAALTGPLRRDVPAARVRRPPGCALRPGWLAPAESAYQSEAAQGHAEPVLVPAGFAPAPVRVLPPSPAFSRAHATPDMAFSPEAPGPVRALGGHSGWVVEEVIDFEDVQEFYGEDLEFPDCAVHPAISEECGVPRIRECLRDGLAEARCLPGGLLGRCYEMCTVWEDVEEES